MYEITDADLENVRHIASMYARRTGRWSDYEDYVQSGYLGLVDAANKFDPSVGVLFKTFYGRRVCGEIVEYIRQNPMGDKKDRFEDRPKVASMEVRELKSSSWFVSNMTPEGSYERTERHDLLMKSISGLASKMAAAVYLVFMRDMSQEETAVILKLSPGRVSQLLSESRYCMRSNVLAKCWRDM